MQGSLKNPDAAVVARRLLLLPSMVLAQQKYQ